jgi:hypothetical protein
MLRINDKITGIVPEELRGPARVFHDQQMLPLSPLRLLSQPAMQQQQQIQPKKEE